MAENSKIEWCDHTFNPWIGCTKISPACDNCYAEHFAARFNMSVNWGAGNPRHRTSVSNWKKPLKWNRDAEKSGTRPRVFCASLADVFDNEVSSEWRKDLFNLINETPHLDWLLLTKRIGNAYNMMNHSGCFRQRIDRDAVGFFPAQNIWLGATICNQEEADRDIPKLLSIPAVKRFVSIEPMLGNIILQSRCKRDHNNDGDCDKHPDGCPRIDWVICGGESGSNARPMNPDWVRSLRDQCAETGTPFLFKQWGAWCAGEYQESGRIAMQNNRPSPTKGAIDFNGVPIYKIGKNHSGRTLDGVIYNEFPE